MSKCYKRIYLDKPISYIPIHKKNSPENDDKIIGYYLYILKCNRFNCCCAILPRYFRHVFYIFQEPIYN